jgi:hypothetical protein
MAAGMLKQQGFNDADLVDYLRARRNMIYTYSVLPNLAPGSVNAFNVKTLATVNASADGVPKIGTLLADQAISATYAARVLAANQGYAWRFEYNAALTALTTSGPGAIVPAGAGDAIVQYLPMPIRSAGVATCGYALVQGVFTPGTTSFTAGMLKDGDPDLVPGINLAGYATVGLVS